MQPGQCQCSKICDMGGGDDRDTVGSFFWDAIKPHGVDSDAMRLELRPLRSEMIGNDS
jgi:hypothetical protein